MVAASDAYPLEIVLHAASGRLSIAWSDGTTAALPFDELRASCKCGQCEQARRTNRMAPVPPDIRLMGVEPYGENALRLFFDDGHDRGIYPWAYLYVLANSRSTLDPIRP